MKHSFLKKFRNLYNDKIINLKYLSYEKKLHFNFINYTVPYCRFLWASNFS